MNGQSQERLHFPREELRGRTARGGVLNAVFLGGGEGLALAQGLIVTALLGPVAIGLYGIVTTTAMTIVQLRRVGIDEAFVQQSADHQEEEFQKAFSLELTIGVLFSLGLCLIAPLLALVYGDERLLGLTIAVAYLPVFFSLQAPQWIFFRRMDFLRLRLLQFAIPAVTFVVTVPLAALTDSVWALVIGPIAGNAVRRSPRCACRPTGCACASTVRRIRRYLGFSWPIFATSLATAGRPAGPGAGLRPGGRAGRGGVHHAGRHADPVRRSRRPDRDHHDLSRHLRGPGSPANPARAVR